MEVQLTYRLLLCVPKPNNIWIYEYELITIKLTFLENAVHGGFKLVELAIESICYTIRLITSIPECGLHGVLGFHYWEMPSPVNQEISVTIWGEYIIVWGSQCHN